MTVLLIKGFAFTALLVYATVTDLKRREIDDWVSAAILVVSLIGSGGSFWGLVLTALPFIIPAYVKSGAIGGGDIKLMGACGAVLGVWGGLLQVCVGLSLAALFSIGIMVRKGFTVSRTIKIPLAPFLSAGGILAFIINTGGFPF